MADDRSIELTVEVPGTADEVWDAVATGPGISSWYVPHRVEERAGGAASASFGPGMEVPGRVTVWDPPRHIRFEGADDGPGLTFDWYVEPGEDGSCVVRLVNGGYGSGPEWDAQYDAMTQGWGLFLANLRLHRQHFAGQAGHAALPMAQWDLPSADAWARLAGALGVDPSIAAGDVLTTAPDGVPAVSGTVQERSPERVSLVLTDPAPGTGFIAAEAQGDATAVSVWLYLYGDDAETLASECQTAWGGWLAANAP